MGLFDDILDTTVKVAGVTLSVAGGVTVNTVRGAAAAVGDAQEIVSGLTRLDLTPIENVAERRISGAVSGIESQVKTAATLLDELGACAMDSDRPFLTDENTERLTSFATAGLVVAAGGSLVSSVLPDDLGFDGGNETSGGLLASDLSSIPTEDGMFDGDSGDLSDLAKAGELEDTDHIESEDITRSLASRDAFLEENGYDGVPDGYEVHHIVPLSEGGADTPDNMILLTEDDHAEITAEHGRFYGWHRA